jgi:isopentenyl-diphosphate delta-isomerase
MRLLRASHSGHREAQSYTEPLWPSVLLCELCVPTLPTSCLGTFIIEFISFRVDRPASTQPDLNIEHVVLVDESDVEVGTMEKMEAHRKGVLHRAFSILIVNSTGEWLLQRRAWKKYHSAGLWTNTCCSHPLPGETMEAATERKLQQEMGMRAPLKFAYKFKYKAALGDLTEHELDYVYTGISDIPPKVNPEEVAEWRYVAKAQIQREISEQPALFTPWFKLIIADKKLAI